MATLDDQIAQLQKTATQNESMEWLGGEAAGWARSMLAAIPSGIFKIFEGAATLGATLLDLGVDKDRAEAVEQWFADINTFDEAAGATGIGKITELIVNIGVPGGLAFKAASGLGRATIAAQKAGKYLSTGEKARRFGQGMLGAGAAEGAVDAANILKPALARGDIQVIGATTQDDYRKYVEKDKALERRFQPVTIDEPDGELIEDYETKKKKEVLSAMKRQGRKLSDKDKDKIANKVVTSKGDTSKSDDRYAYEELNQVRKLVEKVLTPGAKLAKLRADDELFGAPKKPWNKVRKVTDQETSQKVRDRQGKWKNEEVENDSGMEHNLEVLGMLSEKEVKVKDTKKVVDAIRAYDKSKDASRDATADSDEGDKEKADIEKKYAAKERGEIDKDDPNWKKRKYHTGIHGEEVEILKGLLESGKLSEEEVKSILWEGYQRNPEEGERKEREANKKYERVRGERTPMPPRGNKKREEFEKWYAANVR